MLGGLYSYGSITAAEEYTAYRLKWHHCITSDQKMNLECTQLTLIALSSMRMNHLIMKITAAAN